MVTTIKFRVDSTRFGKHSRAARDQYFPRGLFVNTSVLRTPKDCPAIISPGIMGVNWGPIGGHDWGPIEGQLMLECFKRPLIGPP